MPTLAVITGAHGLQRLQRRRRGPKGGPGGAWAFCEETTRTPRWNLLGKHAVEHAVEHGGTHAQVLQRRTIVIYSLSMGRRHEKDNSWSILTPSHGQDDVGVGDAHQGGEHILLGGRQVRSTVVEGVLFCFREDDGVTYMFRILYLGCIYTMSTAYLQLIALSTPITPVLEGFQRIS